MALVHAIVLLSFSTLAWGQRPFFAGSRPIGYPEIARPTTAVEGDLGNRFGEASSTTPGSNKPTTTLRPLPIEALGDRDLVDRLSKLPLDQQPFWLLNWQALDKNRKNPQTYPQSPNNFNSPPNSGLSSSNSGATSANSGASSLDSRFSDSNSGIANSNFGSISNSGTTNKQGNSQNNDNKNLGSPATLGNINKGSSVTTNLHPHRNQWSQSSGSSLAGSSNKPVVSLKPNPASSNYFENINTFLESDSDPYADYEEFIDDYRREMKHH